ADRNSFRRYGSRVRVSRGSRWHPERSGGTRRARPRCGSRVRLLHGRGRDVARAGTLLIAVGAPGDADAAGGPRQTKTRLYRWTSDGTLTSSGALESPSSTVSRQFGAVGSTSPNVFEI